MMLQKINNKVGFTLIELMVVVVIIAIAVAIMIPMIASILDNSGQDSVKIVDQEDESEPEQEKPKPPEKEMNKL